MADARPKGNPKNLQISQSRRDALARALLPKLRVGERIPLTGKQLGKALGITASTARRTLCRMLKEHGVKVVVRRVPAGCCDGPANRETVVVSLPSLPSLPEIGHGS